MKLISKSDTQKFLQDVADLETKAFTLEQAAEEYEHCLWGKTDIDYQIRKQKEELKYCQNWIEDLQKKSNEQLEILDDSERELQRIEAEGSILANISSNNISSTQIRNKAFVSEAKTLGCGIGCFSSIIIAICIIAFATLLSGKYLNDILFNGFVWLIILTITIVLCVIGIIVGGKEGKMKAYTKERSDDLERQKNSYTHEHSRAKNELLRINTMLEEFRGRYQQAESKLEDLYAQLDVVKKQKEISTAFAQSCRQSAQTIRGNLAKIYEAADLIPPDYREMDCVLAFQQIFRNDLADTMREAVMIYEQRVFRQEVIRGMDLIYQELHDLNSSMYYLKHTLTSIHDNVSMMSQDLFQVVGKMDQMSQQMSDGGKLQDKLLRETKASRYAIDAIRQSQSKCEEYLEKMQSSSE